MNVSRVCAIRLFALLALLPGSATSHAQTLRNLGSVLDSAGALSTNTITLASVAYRHASASGQPGAIFSSSNGALTHLAGFLQAVDIKTPGLDSDSDGLANELDLDNDNDGLADATEIAGDGFAPANPNVFTDLNTADSDGDGMSDGAEAVAGTSPTNSNALLEILAINSVATTNQVIQWSARGDGAKQYQILSSTRVPPTNVIATRTVTGGAPPWFDTTAAFTNAGQTNLTQFYRVQALP